MLKVVENGAGREGAFRAGPDRAGSSAADADGGVETEAADYVERYRHERDDEGRALVVHNGRSEGRKLTLGAGRMELRALRVNDRRRDEQGQRQRFTQPHRAARHAAFAQGGRGASHPLSARFSTICTGSPRAIFALRSKGCRARTRPVCRRPTSPDLPPAGKEYTAFRRGGRAGREYVYVWVDGVHLNLRLSHA
jgi:putative transposase